ncbi:Rv3654c family TadE-like protein [Microbacterium sulfonylureivorans]|uniref:Rv3654c family TadE-like protein n=1 Tax=Microbacterium sulfonylureivorans TaxID=2486854 RepID=UPI000FDC3305|nr:Rv3654c family TadE-like protein [Microbacterium sulfonylureivorans]
MAGAAVVVGMVGGAAALTVALAAVGSAAVFGQRLAGAADAAALAAADTASGAVTGVPCERAAEVAAVAGVAIDECEVEGLIATVTVSARFGAFPVAASARAGPPS